jgi:hypothetical protein
MLSAVFEEIDYLLIGQFIRILQQPPVVSFPLAPSEVFLTIKINLISGFFWCNFACDQIG